MWWESCGDEDTAKNIKFQLPESGQKDNYNIKGKLQDKKLFENSTIYFVTSYV